MQDAGHKLHAASLRVADLNIRSSPAALERQISEIDFPLPLFLGLKYFVGL